MFACCKEQGGARMAKCVDGNIRASNLLADPFDQIIHAIRMDCFAFGITKNIFRQLAGF